LPDTPVMPRPTINARVCMAHSSIRQSDRADPADGVQAWVCVGSSLVGVMWWLGWGVSGLLCGVEVAWQGDFGSVV
ncbi:hypothetical protein, partial [Kitasatospora sp. NPDC007106]|uniref:hypothetical protein n=1 Tax=Kitasatospora sp. NPDC007106 TaxID=3156914 RepID=UPI003402C3E4